MHAPSKKYPKYKDGQRLKVKDKYIMKTLTKKTITAMLLSGKSIIRNGRVATIKAGCFGKNTALHCTSIMRRVRASKDAVYADSEGRNG